MPFLAEVANVCTVYITNSQIHGCHYSSLCDRCSRQWMCSLHHRKCAFYNTRIYLILISLNLVVFFANIVTSLIRYLYCWCFGMCVDLMYFVLSVLLFRSHLCISWCCCDRISDINNEIYNILVDVKPLIIQTLKRHWCFDAQDLMPKTGARENWLRFSGACVMQSCTEFSYTSFWLQLEQCLILYQTGFSIDVNLQDSWLSS